MKAILITYNQAYYDEIAATLNDNGVKGFTEWNEIKGHGSNTGEPHYGTHAWRTTPSSASSTTTKWTASSTNYTKKTSRPRIWG